MPWTVGDVDEHKKGLSPAKKEEWVSIANGVLKDCMENGKSESDCEAQAIRVANSQVTDSEDE